MLQDDDKWISANHPMVSMVFNGLQNISKIQKPVTYSSFLVEKRK